MAECGSLENCYTRKRIGSSNLPLSVFFFLNFFLFSVPLYAEIIQLKNGNAIETKILEENEEFVTVQAPGGTVKIPQSDIRTIWRGNKEELLEVRGREVHFAKGVELYKDGSFKEAAENFEQAIGPGAPNPILYANLGSAYASIGEARKAEANFLRAFEQKPDDPVILLNAAHFYETEKNFPQAILYYQKALKLRPADMAIRRGLAYCEYMTGHFQVAAEMFEALGRQNDVVASCNAAAAFIQAEEFEKAETILTGLLEASFPVPRAYFLMGTLCRSRKDYATAEDYYKKGLLRDPKTAGNHFGLGQLYFDLKEWDKAESHFNQVLEKDPQNPGAIRGLAQILTEKKEFTRAAELYEGLLKKTPGDPSALNELGLVYLKADDPQKALEVFHKLFSIDDRYAKGHANAGLAYAFLGDVPNAFKEWSRALELDPGLEAAAQNKKLLEEAMRGDAGKKDAAK